MKKIIAGIFALTTAVLSSKAGPVDYSDQKTQAQTSYQASEQWYRDQEWNFDLFGAYAFTARPYQSDRYLRTDHAWGGGIDANFMFDHYFGVGVEGYGLAAEDAVGQASGNLIFRYPIPQTRFAPYVYAGGGVIFDRGNDLVDRDDFQRHHDTRGMGQFGGGFEVRITPHIGLINDFSWNVLDGPRDDFGMVRSGIRFAF
jgi:Outer membrane protein beta-barrel domain